MSLFRRVTRAWIRLCLEARRLWDWHHAQMQTNGRYARAFVQGVVRALWQRTVERFVFALVEALVEVYLILRQDGFDVDDEGFTA